MSLDGEANPTNRAKLEVVVGIKAGVVAVVAFTVAVVVKTIELVPELELVD